MRIPRPIGFRRIIGLAFLLATGLDLQASGRASAHFQRRLTFEDRVRAQEAIERVYHRHQNGPTTPFEEAVPPEVLEKQVRTYLKQSVALEKLWKRPITGEHLRAELERIAANTRFPDRLREIYDALGNDSLLILECLARATLVDRVARELFAFDPQIHAAARAAAESFREELLGGVTDAGADHPRRIVLELVGAGAREGAAGPARPLRPDPGPPGSPIRIDLGPLEFAGWRARLPSRVGEAGSIIEEPEAFVIHVLLEREPEYLRVASFVFRKTNWDEWWEQARRGLDESSLAQAAVDGGSIPEPAQRGGERWVAEMATAASGGSLETLAACVPGELWSPTSTASAPPERFYHTAVWTGSVMIVWGGRNSFSPYLLTGGRYDPATDTWTATSTMNAPAARYLHTAVWTGGVMIVWGGDGGNFINTGGRYDALADAWSPTSITNAPAPRYAHTAIWTGREMVVWGGQNGSGELATGGLYNPATDNWTATSMTNAPSPRLGHQAVWTGSLMIVWGGAVGATNLNTGGRYSPATNTWIPTSTVNAPLGRTDFPAVWTGSRMIVWGGYNFGSLGTGGRYDPLTDAWSATSATNAPVARYIHTAVWTGGVMVVWGGFGAGTFLNTGGRYDPAMDAWSCVTTAGAPAGRYGHTAVWTGCSMAVWGGDDFNTPFNTGGQYTDAEFSSDGDADGFSECDGDCDDSDPAVHPGATEVCDGRDNNCDGQSDEYLGSTTCGAGQCQRTVQNCLGGVPQTCAPGTPSTEICDGLDNDCDGRTEGPPSVTLSVYEEDACNSTMLADWNVSDWGDLSTGPRSLELYWEDMLAVDSLPDSASSYFVPSCSPNGAACAYQLRAVNGCGLVGWSNLVYARNTVIPEAPEVAVLDVTSPGAAGGATDFSWSATPFGGSEVYDLLRSDDPPGAQAVCLASRIPGLEATDSTNPIPGQSLFYLVRISQGCRFPGPTGGTAGLWLEGQFCP